MERCTASDAFDKLATAEEERRLNALLISNTGLENSFSEKQIKDRIRQIKEERPQVHRRMIALLLSKRKRAQQLFASNKMEMQAISNRIEKRLLEKIKNGEISIDGKYHDSPFERREIEPNLFVGGKLDIIENILKIDDCFIKELNFYFEESRDPKTIYLDRVEKLRKAGETATEKEDYDFMQTKLGSSFTVADVRVLRREFAAPITKNVGRPPGSKTKS